jgi:hypothetical protein
MNRSKTIQAVALSLSIGFFGFGCGGEEEIAEAPKQEVKKIVKKQKPKPKTVEELQQELSFDLRIKLDEQSAPRDEKSRVALFDFFDAMLKADAAKLKNSLSFSDKLELDAMMNSGLADYMKQVSRVDLQVGASPSGDNCVIAIYEIDMEYQAQLWYFNNEGDTFSFESVSTPPNLVNILSGNWIASFFDWEAKQAEIAMQPDAGATYILAGDTDKEINSEHGSGSSPGNTPAPKSPGGPKKPGF